MRLSYFFLKKIPIIISHKDRLRGKRTGFKKVFSKSYPRPKSSPRKKNKKLKASPSKKTQAGATEE